MVPPRIRTAYGFVMNSGNFQSQVGTGTGRENHFVEDTKGKSGRGDATKRRNCDQQIQQGT